MFAPTRVPGASGVLKGTLPDVADAKAEKLPLCKIEWDGGTIGPSKKP